MESYRERASAVAGAAVWTRGVVPGRVQRILPDGCVDVLATGGTLLVAGPSTRARLAGPAEAPPGTRLTGLRFAPGTASAVLGVPAHQLTDRWVPLAALWPERDVRELTERVAAAPGPGRVLEQAVLTRGGSAAADPLVTAVVTGLARGRPVAALAAELGLGERRLRRLSRTWFGYGPKTLARILRLGRALDLVRAGVPRADAAARAGCADQAHLAREVRELAGLPLSALLREEAGRT